MKRSQWFTLTFVAVVALAGVVAALFALRSSDVSAHITGSAHVEIDMVQDAGNTWCNPVQTSASHAAGENYQVAVCLTGATASPGAFQFDLVYDDVLNDAPETSCPAGDCLDDNPDANVGTTSWTSPNLGTGWDCNIQDLDEPVGDKDPATGAGAGRAYISCMTATGTATLPVGADVSRPLALVRFTAQYEGSDTLSLESVAVFDENVILIVECYSPTDPCYDATDNKTGEPVPATGTPTNTPTTTPTPWCGGQGQPVCPTSTPTPKAYTPVPTATETEVPPPGEPTVPPPPPPPPPPPEGGPQPIVQPPPTGSGPDAGISWPVALALAVAGVGALSLGAGGIYLRMVRNR